MNFEVIQDLKFVNKIIWNNVSVVSWNMAQLLVFILLMLRIYHTFNDSVFKVSKWVYIVFGILLFLYILCCGIWIIQDLIVLKIYYKNTVSLYDTYKYLNTGYVIAVEIIDLFILLLLSLHSLNK